MTNEQAMQAIQVIMWIAIILTVATIFNNLRDL